MGGSADRQIGQSPILILFIQIFIYFFYFLTFELLINRIRWLFNSVGFDSVFKELFEV